MTDLVVKSNKLVQALQSLSLSETRLLQIAIIDARETGQGLSTDAGHQQAQGPSRADQQNHC